MNKNFGCTKGEEMKNVKRNVIVSAVMAIALCMSIVAGATFALFTSNSSVNIAITSGNVEVTATASDLTVYSPTSVNEDGIVNADNAVDENGGRFVNGGTATLTGSELKLDNMTPGDKVNFNIKVENKSTVTVKYRTRIYCGEDNGLYAGLKYSITNGTETYESMAITDWATLTPDVREAADLACEVELPVEAGNEYKNKSCKLVYQVEAVQGNAETANDTRYYTLAQFNALTEIPAEVKNVYVDLGNASLESGLVIGNENIADHYHYGEWNQTTAPAGYPYDTGRIDTRESDNAVRHIYSTGKNGYNLILTGKVKGATDTGNFNAGAITLKVPDACDVKFEGVTFGEGQMSLSFWTEAGVQSMTVSHTGKSLTFNKCTFNGNWIQNGAVGVKTLTYANSTFNRYDNKASKNNSNPIWIQNLGNTDVVIDGCTFNACRPIKLWEGTANGSATITNNVFDMFNFDDAAGSDLYKNVAVMFCQSKLGNVEVANNTVKGNATGFIAFYDNTDHYPTMNAGATFKVYGNTLNGTKEFVLWKSETEWKPTYYNA